MLGGPFQLPSAWRVIKHEAGRLGGSHLGSWKERTKPELTMGGRVGLKTKSEIKNPILKFIRLSRLLEALTPIGKGIVTATRWV